MTELLIFGVLEAVEIKYLVMDLNLEMWQLRRKMQGTIDIRCVRVERCAFTSCGLGHTPSVTFGDKRTLYLAAQCYCQPEYNINLRD